MNEVFEYRLKRLERSISLLQFGFFVIAVLLFANLAKGNDAQLAELDRQQFPAEYWPNIYYVTTAPLDEADRDELAIALNLMIPSSSRQTILERCLPFQVGPTLYRLDLANLQWDPHTWQKIVSHHPYSLSENPLTIRGDWLLLQLADSQESDAYYQLVFGKVPATRDEAFAILGVDPSPSNRFGMIEGKSGVNVNGLRWIENRAIYRGNAWLTRDSIKLDGQHDMLEQPDGNFKHDGEEAIVGIPKLHLASGTRGVLQVYFLANGQGKIVGRAPVDLVVDHTNFRGLNEIRNPGSCIQCHETGMNPLKQNEFRLYLESGVEAYADYENQQALEAFHLADLEKELARNSADYCGMVRLATGVESPKATLAFRVSVNRYDRAVSLERAAGELYTTAQELKAALAWASANGTRLTARLSGLAHGHTISRPAWEEQYLNCRTILANWSQR
jgi:hypothetical protein